MRDNINILHISPYFNYVCGVSKYVYLLLRGLKELSVDCIPKINLYFITNGGDALQRLNSLGIKPHIIDFKRGMANLFYLIPNTCQLKEYCLSNNIDIIHSHHRYPELISNIIKKRIFKKNGKKIKTITTVHSIVNGYRNLSFQSDKIIAVSKTVRKNLINNYNVSEEKIIQFYNPVDKSNNYEKKRINRSNLEIDDQSKIILFVGRYSKEKGVDVLVKAFLEVSKVYDLYLLMITDAKDNIKRKILNKSDKIIFIKPCDDITMYYEISDIVVVPSLIESCPFVVLEAGINKKLLIASNVDGNSESLEDGKHAVMFDAGNKKKLIEAIQKALNMSEVQKQKLAENLHEKVNTFFDYKIYAEKLYRIYLSMLNDS